MLNHLKKIEYTRQYDMKYIYYNDKKAYNCIFNSSIYVIIASMKNKIVFYISTFILLLFLSGDLYSQANEANAILGIWLTGSKKGKVEIYKCGDLYCGKIIWLRDPTYEDGTPKRDKNNPDEAKQKKLIIGSNILTGFEYDCDEDEDECAEWDDGEIYDPDNGKTYSCVINMQDNKKILDVRGYIGVSLFGRTEEWIKSSLD